MFSILLVTGCAGHLRTDKDGIDQSFHCQADSPQRIHEAISRGETVRLSSGVVATVLLYAIVKFNVRLSRVDFFIIFTSDYPDFNLTGKQRQEQRSAKVLVQPVK